jgi:hypothetical protein
MAFRVPNMAETEPILLVDEEANRCRLLQRRLERHGFSVSSAASLAEAVNSSSLPTRVVVVDLALLCGTDRDRIEELVGRLLDAAVYRCQVCGRRLREVGPVVSEGAVTCCGQRMERTWTGHQAED